MRRSLPSFRQATLLLLMLFLLLLLVTHTSLAMDGVRRGLSLCIETLIPSLFPFLVFSELFVASGAADGLGRLFSRPVSALFGISGVGAAAALLGGLCGSPTGAVAAASLCDRGEIEKDEFDRLLLFCSNPSSGFLVGAVGEALFGNHRAGVALFLITLFSSATIGLFLHAVLGPTVQTSKKLQNGIEKPLSPSDFIHSIKRAFSSLLQICAFVLFFSCLSLCLSHALDALHTPPIISVWLTGILEMTSGISAAVTALNAEIAFCLTAFFAGFSGISICLQVLSVTEKLSPRPGTFLLARFVQGGVSLLLAQAYLFLFKPTLSVGESVDTFAVQHPPIIPFVLFVLLIIGIWTSKRKKRTAPGV